MEIIDGPFECLGSVEIAIVARTLLPVSKAKLSWSFADRQSLQQIVLGLNENLLDLLREWLLQPSQEMTDFGLRQRRINQQMDVFRHVHKRDELERMLRACLIDVS